LASGANERAKSENIMAASWSELERSNPRHDRGPLRACNCPSGGQQHHTTAEGKAVYRKNGTPYGTKDNMKLVSTLANAPP